MASGGTQGNQDSAAPAISADGRFVAFASPASNLVAGDTNDRVDVLVQDRDTKATTRVSVASGGTQGNHDSGAPAISADGRLVAFASQASNLVAGDTNARADVFVHDRDTGATTRVSVASDGTQGNAGSNNAVGSGTPALSADGRFVAFSSGATNLVAGDTNTWADVFVHDRSTRATTRVSVASDGTQGDGNVGAPALSADGRFVAFESHATNLVAGETNTRADVFVHDRSTGATTRVSVAGNTNYTSYSAAPAISADGRFVAFASPASNLVAGDTNDRVDVFVHDRDTKATTRVNVARNSTQGNADSFAPAISADGRFVAFASDASNLVGGDTNTWTDVFLHDRSTRTLSTTRVSLASDGTQANQPSDAPAISANGRVVAFDSRASNLVAGDTNAARDVFIRDRIFRPDAQIKTSRGYVGDDIYNLTGARQTKSLSIAPRGRAVFTIAVQNGGNTIDSYRLKGSGAQPGFTATYGKSEVTKQVVAGTFTLARLDPCDAKTIKLEVTANTARSGTTKSWLITATSASRARAQDAVKATVTVAR